jgi:hypothetical protein
MKYVYTPEIVLKFSLFLSNKKYNINKLLRYIIFLQ